MVLPEPGTIGVLAGIIAIISALISLDAW